MEAVYTLLDIERAVPEVWGSTYDIRDLLKATVALRDGKAINDGSLGPVADVAIAAVLSKIHGTEIEKLLRRYGVTDPSKQQNPVIKSIDKAKENKSKVGAIAGGAAALVITGKIIKRIKGR